VEVLHLHQRLLLVVEEKMLREGQQVLMREAVVLELRGIVGQ
jgi:hypothetical protein